MGMGDKGNFVPLPDTAPLAVPAGGFTDFEVDWTPKSSGHTCIRAEILSHGSALGELDLSNNRAQENVNDFHPTAGSPYEPVDFEFTVNSDFDAPVEVEFAATGLPPGMSLELEEEWFELDPDEERTVRGRLRVDEGVILPLPEAKRRCRYRFNMHAFVRTPDYLLPFGGITIQTHPSYGSEFKLRGAYLETQAAGEGTLFVTGELVGEYNANQPVDAIIVATDGVTYQGTGETDSNGAFTIEIADVPAGGGRLMLYYFGPDLSPSTLGPEAVKF